MGARRSANPLTVSEIAAHLGATLRGDGSPVITGIGAIDCAEPDQLTFLANPKYRKHLAATKAAAVIAGKGVEAPAGITILECEDPYWAFRSALLRVYGERKHLGFSELNLHPSATVASGSIIHPSAVIDAGASVGSNCVVYANVHIGRDCVLGDGCVLYPNVVLYEGCRLGSRVIIQAGSVIGCDGYGFATHAGRHERIPQTGIVVIGDDVDIGACCSIARAAIGETQIGEGTKIADLVTIGHGCTIGKHCLIVSLTGISGSVDIGNYVVMGGQVGVTGHLSIADGAQIAARSVVVNDIPAGAKVAGMPAIDHDLAKKNIFAALSLYELTKRVKQLERQLAQLNAGPEKKEL